MKSALKGTDTAAIKSETEALTKLFYEMSEKLYKQNGGPGPDAGAGAAGAGDPGAGTDANGNQYYDADYKEVDDDKK